MTHYKIEPIFYEQQQNAHYAVGIARLQEENKELKREIATLKQEIEALKQFEFWLEDGF